MNIERHGHCLHKSVPTVGDIWRDNNFLLHDHSKVVPHYLLVLGVDRDWVTWRTFTTRSHGRPAIPGCYPNGFRAGYFVGIPGVGQLTNDSWVDFGPFDDVDSYDFTRRANNGQYELIGSLDKTRLCNVLLCGPQSMDVTPRQAKRMKDARSKLGCP